MRFDALYELCASLPHAALSVQWGDHDVFKVGGKIFAILTQDIDLGFRLSIKAEPDAFDEVCGEHGVRPAPYLARNQWVQIVADNGLGPERLRHMVVRSHGLVLEKLSPAARRSLDAPGAPAKPKPAAPKRSTGATRAVTKATTARKGAAAKAVAKGKAPITRAAAKGKVPASKASTAKASTAKASTAKRPGRVPKGR